MSNNPIATPSNGDQGSSSAMPSFPPTSSNQSSFKAPPNPNIPQDIAVIMELVANNEVIGALPPVATSAAEKRKQVEENLKNKKQVEEGSSSDSDSSSEFESSSEEESEDGKAADKKPMTAEEHQSLKAQLDAFIGENNGDANVEFEYDSDPESDDSEDYNFSLDKTGFEFMEDDEDIGPADSGPVLSRNEVPLPVVQQPPMIKLPEGERLSLAGDVVSWMPEKRLEAWLEKGREEGGKKGVVNVEKKTDEGSLSGVEESEAKEVEKELAIDPQPESIEDSTGVVAEQQTNNKYAEAETEQVTSAAEGPAKKVSKAEPTFTSAGTVVVRAMQSRPGDFDDGWLEEGSILCWEDGRVMGTVYETFGPLTSPFYTVRLPPPPFPYPTPGSLATGTRLFYPFNPSYRSFVNMIAVRDPRYKGTDASNIYDEEVAEEEMEWSDDEAEAAAKRERKQKKKGNRQSSVSGTPRGGRTSLPSRQHWDHQPNDETMSETGSLYGGGDDNRWEVGSDAGSTASGRGRPMPVSYGDLDDLSGQSTGGRAGGGRGGGRGRGNQGRDRGRGRGGRSSYPLPPRPLQDQSFSNQWQPQQQFVPAYPAYGQSYPQMTQSYPQQPQNASAQHAPYEPHQPSAGMGATAHTYTPQGQQDVPGMYALQPQQQQGMYSPYPQGQYGGASPMYPMQLQGQQGGVAINPQFAAQYQMMVGMAQVQARQQGGQRTPYRYGQQQGQ
ncbi:hypothetical protein LQV05_005015 [Cryptococcus neoformans]|nr:H/ACA ribonucleoprotein complex non-core subunit NAF1 [Cryptococcus neoformans var. grubii]OXC61308.1 H/ACA ribonucleoprotein complex non-core subunit NAF1 [Cryptococcus neoformans var. grubii MW-RSA852]UOH82317.1 hypothetical protein LQV05_005015 [Cryptococcus neoformans]